MIWWQNIPFFSILLCLLSAAVCSVLPSRAARIWSHSVLAFCFSGASVLLVFLLQPGRSSFTFTMGHFPAPWGNEIRSGILEALLACLFPFIMLCSLVAGQRNSGEKPGPSRENLYHTLCMLLMASLLSQIYSNDLFTCYVFLEIMTASSCALIIYRNTGRSLVAGIRYMVLNMVGSGLFLLGVVLLYDLTGHLLMENLNASLQTLAVTEQYHRSLTIIIGLITVGLAVKSALFPFHSWVPEAYSSGTASTNAIVSSLVSKGYIILLLKIYIRVFGWNLVLVSQVDSLLMVFALCGMIFGSLGAIRTRSFTRMIAWSSVAQIGYIYLGISMGAGEGYQAAVFHLIVHACAKSLLFLSAEELKKTADGRDDFDSLSGAARRRPAAGICWTVGAFSLVGLPFTGGLISKILLGTAAFHLSEQAAAVILAVLALSTLLNVLYLLRTMIVLWAPARHGLLPASRSPAAVSFSFGFLAVASVMIFFLAFPLLQILSQGLLQF